jgi:hypothetical protein
MNIIAIAAPIPERGILNCPICGSQHVVPTHLDCRALGTTRGEIQVGEDGVRIDPAIPDPEGGATIGLRCTCDLGHDSILRFRQVLGATIVERTACPWTAHPGAADEGDRA